MRVTRGSVLVTFLPSCPQRSLSKPCTTRAVAGSQSASPRAPRRSGFQIRDSEPAEVSARLTPGRRPCYQNKGIISEHHPESEKAR